MAGRLSRFLNLEGARPANADAPAKSLTASGRFNPPESRAPPPEISPADSANAPADLLLARRRAQLESGLALDDRSDDEQPFIRCGQCETDSARGAVRCKTCGAALDTPEQRAFNEQLWEAQRAANLRETAAHQQQASALSQAEGGDPNGPASAQWAFGEALAREVREKESERLSWMRGPSNRGGISLGKKLLAMLPDQRLREIAAVSYFALLLTLGGDLLFTPRAQRSPLLTISFIALFFLCVPLPRRDP